MLLKKNCKRLSFKNSFARCSWIPEGNHHNLFALFFFFLLLFLLFICWFLGLLLVIRFLAVRFFAIIRLLVLAIAWRSYWIGVIAEATTGIDVIEDHLLGHLELVTGQCVVDLYWGFFSDRRGRRWIML